jgi:hypothetical protein
MPDITDLAKEHEKRRFKLETEKHGTIRFDTLVVWRLELILEKNNKLEQIPSDEFCLNVAKCMLLDFDGVAINQGYYKKIKKLSDLTLDINIPELEKFTESFIKNNQESVLGDFSQKQLNTLSNVEIIKKFFLREKKRYDDLVESITGFSSVNLTPQIFSSINAISKISNWGKSISPLFDNNMSEITRLTNSLSEATKPIFEALPHPSEITIPEIHDYKLETLVSIEKTLSYYSELIKLSNECLNQIKTKIESQIDSAEKNSKEAKKSSTIAIIIAVVALSASIVFGVIQSSLSNKANVQTQELNTSIKNFQTAVEEANTSIKALQQSIITNQSYYQEFGEALQKINTLPVLSLEATPLEK